MENNFNKSSMIYLITIESWKIMPTRAEIRGDDDMQYLNKMDENGLTHALNTVFSVLILMFYLLSHL